MTELLITDRYLNLPVRTGAPTCKVVLRTPDGGLAAYFEIELGTADDSDFWAFRNVSAWRGTTLAVDVTGGDGGRFQEVARQSPAPLGLAGVYREQQRPQYHFTSRRGWLNDPNGLVHYDGVWHLFYQHNPFGWHWGNMHWGHAVSRDLLHWQETDDALYPDALGTIYSGSAVVDWPNTSGLQSGDQPPILLFYTAAGGQALSRVDYTQCLAVSCDGCRTFAKYSGNPIVPHIDGANRDPKVVRHEPSGQWIMALYLAQRDDERVFALLRSDDLLSWRQFQEVVLPGSGECPEFFALPVDDGKVAKWVFLGADSHYLVGTFDGRQFTGEQRPRQLFHRDGGGGLYAAQTWSDAPDGRRIMIAWDQGRFPGQRFNGSMSMPAVLSLRSGADGLHLRAAPIAELAGLVTRTHHLDDLVSFRGELLDLELTCVVGGDRGVLTVHGAEIVLDAAGAQVQVLGSSVPVSGAPRFQLRMLVDRGVLELFIDDGRIWLSKRLLDPPDHCLSGSGLGEIEALTIRELRSVWP